jgi:hypothetical protein
VENVGYGLVTFDCDEGRPVSAAAASACWQLAGLFKPAHGRTERAGQIDARLPP